MYDYIENFIEVDLSEKIIKSEIKTQEEHITFLEKRLEAYEASYASGAQKSIK